MKEVQNYLDGGYLQCSLKGEGERNSATWANTILCNCLWFKKNKIK